MHDAEHLGRPPGFGQPHLRPRRTGRRLAVGQVDDAHAMALLGELGQRAAAGDFHIVRVGADGQHVELQIVHRSLGHRPSVQYSVLSTQSLVSN